MEDPRNEKKNRFMSHQHTPLLQLLRSLPEAQISHLPLFSPPRSFSFYSINAWNAEFIIFRKNKKRKDNESGGEFGGIRTPSIF